MEQAILDDRCRSFDEDLDDISIIYLDDDTIDVDNYFVPDDYDEPYHFDLEAAVVV